MAVFFGTNLFHYATRDMGMSHVYSFFLFAFLVWQTPRFYEKPSALNAVLTGAAMGWLVLIRPTNIVVLLFVLLYDVYSWRDLKARLSQFLPQIPPPPAHSELVARSGFSGGPIHSANVVLA